MSDTAAPVEVYEEGGFGGFAGADPILLLGIGLLGFGIGGVVAARLIRSQPCPCQDEHQHAPQEAHSGHQAPPAYYADPEPARPAVTPQQGVPPMVAGPLPTPTADRGPASPSAAPFPMAGFRPGSPVAGPWGATNGSAGRPEL